MSQSVPPKHGEWVCLDGNHAATHVAYAMSDMAAIFPITPASTMGEAADDWASEGRKNIWNNVVKVTQLQSEGGASGTMHGAILSGALTSTFTSSQGLLLMIPELFKLAGELQPGVFHIATRSVGGQAMNIQSDHSDVLACRSTGVVMLASASVQEVLDLAAVAHMSTIQAQIPFMHFFDGFRVSHEVMKVHALKNDDYRQLYDFKALDEWREARTMRNDAPTMRGLVNDANVYMQILEATNGRYNRVPALVQANMDKVAALTGRQYHLFDYFGAADAERVVVVMGAGGQGCEEAIDYLTAKGEKVGLIKVRLYRPFSAEHLSAALPKTVTHVAVLDRTKEFGCTGEPLYLDVNAALRRVGRANIVIAAGRYGLGGKDLTPTMVKAVLDNLSSPRMKAEFTVGVNDDVTHLNLEIPPALPLKFPGMTEALFYGFGADGTVGSCKNSISIIGDSTPLFAQGNFIYDAKKSGGVTISQLRFGPKPITSAYEIQEADYVACHHPSYPHKYDMVANLREGGVFVLNCSHTNVKELEEALPGSMKAALYRKKARFFVIDADQIAIRTGLRGRVNMVMQTVFFKLSNVLPMEQAIGLLKDAIRHSYGKKGDEVVQKNFRMVDGTMDALVPIPIPESWAQAPVTPFPTYPGATKYFKEISAPCLALVGNNLPVSTFLPYVGGIFPTATARYEKRGVAPQVPVWDSEKCIGCNMCVTVCPHATIRSFMVTPEEKAAAPNPATFTTRKGPKPGFEQRIAISPLDCLGCQACEQTCPKKALTMTDDVTSRVAADQKNWDYAVDLPNHSDLLWDPNAPQKPGQVPAFGHVAYRQPLLEFSAACGGCAETPILRLMTTLFGERLVIANTCGCSMVWGGCLPDCAYTVTKEGLGPVYTGSLFEDDAELTLGLALGGETRRDQIALFAERALKEIPTLSAPLRAALEAWLSGKDDVGKSKAAGMQIRKLLEAPEARQQELLQQIFVGRDFFQKKSYWAVGGDGWAYDINFGGLDQVLCMGHKVNVLVMDTEVYSNTGGQKSKATPRGAVARFAAGGKDTKKKDLGMYAMNIGSVYVASCAVGYSMQQLVRALVEADQYPGTSLVICYCPCINHGLKMGQGSSNQEMKLAVQTGYWPIYRYNPLLRKEGKNPLQIDCPPPSMPLKDLLAREVRFTSLIQQRPAVAEKLHAELQADLDERNAQLRAMAAVPVPAPAK